MQFCIHEGKLIEEAYSDHPRGHQTVRMRSLFHEVQLIGTSQATLSNAYRREALQMRKIMGNIFVIW